VDINSASQEEIHPKNKIIAVFQQDISTRVVVRPCEGSPV